jgi:hypothetical protein
LACLIRPVSESQPPRSGQPTMGSAWAAGSRNSRSVLNPEHPGDDADDQPDLQVHAPPPRKDMAPVCSDIAVSRQYDATARMPISRTTTASSIIRQKSQRRHECSWWFPKRRSPNGGERSRERDQPAHAHRRYGKPVKARRSRDGTTRLSNLDLTQYQDDKNDKDRGGHIEGIHG